MRGQGYDNRNWMGLPKGYYSFSNIGIERKTIVWVLRSFMNEGQWPGECRSSNGGAKGLCGWM